MDPKYALKALIKAGMTEERAARFAKRYIDDKSPIAAQVKDLKDDFPDLFGGEPKADEEDETPAKGEPSISRGAVQKHRETVSSAKASLKDGSQTASAVAAQLLARTARPRQSSASAPSQAAAALLRRGIGNSAD